MFFARHNRILSSLKNVILTQRTLLIPGNHDATRLLPVICTIRLMEPRSIHSTSMHFTSAIEKLPMGRFERFLRKTGIIDVQKYKNMALGYYVYEHMMKQIDFPFYFQHFNMTDTLFSWFLIVELHVWMAMVRYMAEGDSGKLIRNNIVAAMWEDVNARVENLGKIKSSIKNKQILELSHQFNAAVIGYDEGMQSDDKVLAGALWRRFFHLECNNPEHVEALVIYVRKQITLFDNLPSEEILKKPILNLIDIKSLCNHP